MGVSYGQCEEKPRNVQRQVRKLRSHISVFFCFLLLLLLLLCSSSSHASCLPNSWNGLASSSVSLLLFCVSLLLLCFTCFSHASCLPYSSTPFSPLFQYSAPLFLLCSIASLILSFPLLLSPFLFFLSLLLSSLLHCFSHSVIPFAPLLILIFLSGSAPLFLLCSIASLILSFPLLLYSFSFFFLCSSLPSLLHCFSHSLILFAPSFLFSSATVPHGPLFPVTLT